MTVYSHSRLSSFENCPRQFKHRYIDKITVDVEGVEAFMGKRVHEILERLYHHVARHGKPPSLMQVLDRFRKDWRQSYHDKIRIVKTEFDADWYVERGQQCLENYYRSWYPFSQGETVGIETRLMATLDDGGKYKAQGIVDRIVRAGPGRYEIHDYKTGGYLPPQKRLDADRQLALYQIGLEQTYDDVEEVELVWHYVAHNKTKRSRREPEQIAALKQETIGLIDTVEAETEFPTRPGPLCRWCDYADTCPDAKGVEPKPGGAGDPFGDVAPPPFLDTPGGPPQGMARAAAPGRAATRTDEREDPAAAQLPLL